MQIQLFAKTNYCCANVIERDFTVDDQNIPQHSEKCLFEKVEFFLLVLTVFGHHLQRLAPLALTSQRIDISARLLLTVCFKDRKKTETIGEGWLRAGQESF